MAAWPVLNRGVGQISSDFWFYELVYLFMNRAALHAAGSNPCEVWISIVMSCHGSECNLLLTSVVRPIIR